MHLFFNFVQNKKQLEFVVTFASSLVSKTVSTVMQSVTTADRLRQADLCKYEILDTPPEPAFDQIAELASYTCKCPIAFIMFVDYDGSRSYVKSGVGQHAGYSMSHSCREDSLCYHACEEESAVLVINDALADDKYKNIPTVIGEPHIRFYAGAPLITPDGYKIGALCVIDQKPNQINAEQEKALQTLAKQVVSQMELRLHINLVNAHNKALEKSNDEKNKFIGLLSQDIRQPIQNIMIAVETMLTDTTTTIPEEHKYRLQTTHSSAKLMHHLVDELLHLKKKELHNLPVNIERRLTNIIPIVQTIVANNSIHAGRKNISLQMMIGAENALQITYSTWLRENAFPLICNIDPLKIEQMLNNLITNAIKFSFPNTVVQVTVGTKESQIYISVQDHGQGIPDDEIPKLFEPFSKISVKPTQGETSTGLGLSIVKSIANSHGGSIDVKSKLGVGTAFTVSLPASTTPRAIEEKNAQIPTIMFVDDSTVLQKLVPYMLKKKEYNVIVCSDGLEAFQEWERNGNINLIIMDEEMPRQTGSDTIELIRKREVELGLTRTPVISCTGVQEKDQNILLRKGADKVCTKPFVSEHLLQMVTELLK